MCVTRKQCKKEKKEDVFECDQNSMCSGKDYSGRKDGDQHHCCKVGVTSCLGRLPAALFFCAITFTVAR